MGFHTGTRLNSLNPTFDTVHVFIYAVYYHTKKDFNMSLKLKELIILKNDSTYCRIFEATGEIETDSLFFERIGLILLINSLIIKCLQSLFVERLQRLP